jgi:hypothetical protein
MHATPTYKYSYALACIHSDAHYMQHLHAYIHMHLHTYIHTHRYMF